MQLHRPRQWKNEYKTEEVHVLPLTPSLTGVPDQPDRIAYIIIFNLTSFFDAASPKCMFFAREGLESPSASLYISLYTSANEHASGDRDRDKSLFKVYQHGGKFKREPASQINRGRRASARTVYAQPD